jgi:hypothetical protein
MYLGHLLNDFVQIWHADSLLLTILSLFVAFTIKGQTKAAAAFKCISAIYWPILFKFGMHIAYRQLFSVCFIAFIKKGQTKAAAACKGILAIY